MNMKKILFGMAVCALALAGCGSHTIFDEPEPIVHTAPDNDASLEKLERNVGYYYGDKPDVTRYEFAYRAAGQYCIFPKTEDREEELNRLSQQEDSQVKNMGGFFWVSRSRDFITEDDFVSDRYFIDYYRGESEFVVICPTIIVRVENPETKDKILDKYRGKLTQSDRSEEGEMPGGYYLYTFDCHLSTSEQALNLADEIYMRNDVTWAETDKYAPIHIDI